MEANDHAVRAMPRYKCHKMVWALKIAIVAPSFSDHSDSWPPSHADGATITPYEEGFAPFEVSQEYIEKHHPKAEGYYVVYEDGYKSYSPAEAFEAGYTLVAEAPFNFGWALDQLRAGKRVSRNNWNGPGQYLELQVPDEHSKMTLPYVYIKTVQGDLVPWLASQTDMLASDWCMVPVDVPEQPTE